MISIFVFLFGLVIGSFLNCVIYRLEKDEGLSGRSHCPKCKHQLSWQDLIPLLSYVLLLGKCRYCKKKISLQYPLVELATGSVFLIIFNQFQVFNVFLAYLFVITSLLIVIFVYDLKHYIIPDKVLFPAIVLALLYNLIFNIRFLLFDALWGSFWPALFFFALFFFSKGKWIGFGDVKFAVLMGLFLGSSKMLVALFLAVFFGGIIGIGLMIFCKKSLRSEIPFGPFLVLGTFLALLWGEKIINWYLNYLI